MRKFIENWRFYSYGKDQYYDCMSKVFLNNLNSLRQANILVAVIVGVFSVYPIAIEYAILGKEGSLFNTSVYLGTALIAFGLSLYMNYKMQTGEVNHKFIYFFITFFYINVMAFVIYVCVWMYPDNVAAIYFPVLVCSLLMFLNPPIFNLVLTICAMAAFVICSYIVKKPINTENFVLDFINTIASGLLTMFFSWHISKLRMGMEISTTILEEERNKYLNQSTVDELTQLNNRRDFMATFKRYLHNYRTSDDYLCLAISDIDFFKNYNDHYGHPQGDECLRNVGKAFAKLRDDMGVYTARVGGEEFAMLWFEKDAAHVDAVVSRFFELVREMKEPHAKSKISNFVTMSIGVYIEKLGSSHDEEALYELADNALYSAKGAGRNCAIITGRDRKQYKITPPSGDS